MLYTFAYALPPVVLFIFSHRLRAHLRLVVKRAVQSREAAIRKVTGDQVTRSENELSPGTTLDSLG